MATPTKKKIAAYQRRSLQTMRDRLLDMSEAWDGVDGYFETLLTEAADRLLDVRTELAEAPEEARP